LTGGGGGAGLRLRLSAGSGLGWPFEGAGMRPSARKRFNKSGELAPFCGTPSDGFPAIR
jgi:hypothetical protein